MEPILTLEHRGCTIEIHQDPDPENPCEEQGFSLGTIACWHDRIQLGHLQLNRHDNSVEEYLSGLGQAGRDWIGLPIYLYEHSGILLSTIALSCPLDSGQVGVITCSLERATDADRRAWLGIRSHQDITSWHDDILVGGDLRRSTLRDEVLALLRHEVMNLDDCVSGSIYGWYALTPDGEIIESAWGYYPAREGIGGARTASPYEDGIMSAKDAIDMHLARQERLALAACANI